MHAFEYADENDEQWAQWREILYEPEKMRMREDAARRIKPKQPGEEGYLNIDKSKVGRKASFEDLNFSIGGLNAAKKASVQDAATKFTVSPSEDGELDIS